MIYIFEDRHSRRELHQETIDRHKGIVRFVQFSIDDGVNLEDYIIDNFIDAEIILFHRSYAFKNQRVNIDEIIKKMPGVDFVIFSGGTEDTTLSNKQVVLTINADLMYTNLGIFLENYKKEAIPNYGYLGWGNDYVKNQILSIQHQLFNEFFISRDLVAEITEDLTKILEYIADVLMDYNLDPSLFHIPTSYLSNKHPLTWGRLLELIQAQLPSYLPVS